MTLLVLAAGVGNRYGGLKQFDSIGPNGEAIIDYSIHDAILEGFTKVVFVIQRSSTLTFQTRIEEKYRARIKVVCVYQELCNLPQNITVNQERAKPLGTGHAVWAAKNEIKTPFVVINADDFYGRDAFRLIAEHLQSPANLSRNQHCIVGYSIQNTLSKNGPVSRAVCTINESNNLKTLTEHTQIRESNGNLFYSEDGSNFLLTGNEIVSMNMIGLLPSIFNPLEKGLLRFLNSLGPSLTSEFYLPNVLDDLIENKDTSVKILHTSSEWFGITYKADKPEAIKKINALIASGEYPENIWHN